MYTGAVLSPLFVLVRVLTKIYLNFYLSQTCSRRISLLSPSCIALPFNWDSFESISSTFRVCPIANWGRFWVHLVFSRLTYMYYSYGSSFLQYKSLPCPSRCSPQTDPSSYICILSNPLIGTICITILFITCTYHLHPQCNSVLIVTLNLKNPGPNFLDKLFILGERDRMSEQLQEHILYQSVVFIGVEEERMRVRGSIRNHEVSKIVTIVDYWDVRFFEF